MSTPPLIHDWKLLPSPQDANRPEFAWVHLRQFQNDDHVCDRLETLHKVDRSQRSNVRKHARDIRHCLIQAGSYFDAAREVDYATRGVLLYYGASSFAVAQILFRGGGEYRLTKIRQDHGHHGLSFVSPQMKKDGKDIGVAGIKAIPTISGGQRWGTFELWHRFARHYPIVGKMTFRDLQLPESWGPRILLWPDSVRLPLVPLGGINLLSVLQRLPGMLAHLGIHGHSDCLARASVSITQDSFGNFEHRTNVLVHPDNADKLASLMEQFSYPPRAFERLSVFEYASGFGVALNEERDVRMGVQFPNGISESMEKTHFFVDRFPLNEFGCFLFGLYCAGMYARYYPDYWMHDIESANERFNLISGFLDLTMRRLPLVAWMEFSRTYCLVA
jgi:hypothetical protein